MKLINLIIILILLLPYVYAGQASASFVIPEQEEESDNFNSITGAVVGVQENCVNSCVEKGGSYLDCEEQCLSEEGFFNKIYNKIKNLFLNLFK